MLWHVDTNTIVLYTDTVLLTLTVRTVGPSASVPCRSLMAMSCPSGKLYRKTCSGCKSNGCSSGRGRQLPPTTFCGRSETCSGCDVTDGLNGFSERGSQITSSRLPTHHLSTRLPHLSTCLPTTYRLPPTCPSAASWRGEGLMPSPIMTEGKSERRPPRAVGLLMMVTSQKQQVGVTSAQVTMTSSASL